MKTFLAVLTLGFSFSSFALSTLNCEVTEYLKEHEKVLVTKSALINDETGSTYLELGTFKNVTFNATSINRDHILLYGKVNGVTIMSQVSGEEGTLNVFYSDLSNPLTLSCWFN